MSDAQGHPDHPRPPQADAALPPLRSDIEVIRRQVAGRAEYILKDPLSNRYFRAGEHEWFIARQLDGRRTLADIRARAERQFPEMKFDDQQIRRFAQRLALAGMLRLGGRQDLERLMAERKPGRFGRLLAVAGQVFFFRIPLVNPDRFVARLAPKVAFLMQPRTLLAAGLLVAAALVLALWQSHRLAEPHAEFLSPQGILSLLVALVFIKVLHELAHATVCKHLGGHVPEMGIVFIVFTPCLYCDVSDAWMFASRTRRLAVTAAGIAVELVLAALAAIVFFLTRPGWLHQASFSIMVAASLSTLLFNGNPLLRYDGYYLLSDALEMPNLRLRARRYVAALARRLMFGTPLADFDRPTRRRPFVLLYAVASYLYGWFILYLILGVVYRKLEPYGLQALAAALITLSITIQIGLPLWRLLAALARLARTRGNLWRFTRPALITAALTLLAAVLLSIPFNETMTRACVIEPLDPIDIRAPHDGFVLDVRAACGRHVEPGTVLVVLDNPELQLQRDQAAAELRVGEILLARARAAADQTEVRKAQAELAKCHARLDAAQADLQELTITAAHPGRVLTDLPEDLKGQYVRKGDLLLRLARPGEFKVTLELSQQAAQRVPEGSLADLRVHSQPTRIFEGRVVRNAWTESTRTPAVLTTRFGGDVPLQLTPGGFQTAHKVYRAEMEILDPAALLRPGISGKARIQLGRRTVGGWLWRTARDQLSLDLLLKWQAGT